MAPNAGRADSGESLDIQSHFQNIQNSYKHLRLPENLKLQDRSKAGIKRDSQSHAAVISKCARQSETILKILSDIPIQEEQLESKLIDISDCAKAQIKYLQSEYATLGKKTGQLYKAFQAHTSNLGPEERETALISAQLAAVQIGNDRDNRDRNQGGRGRFNYGRGSRSPQHYFGPRFSSQFNTRFPNTRVPRNNNRPPRFQSFQPESSVEQTQQE